MIAVFAVNCRLKAHALKLVILKNALIIDLKTER